MTAGGTGSGRFADLGPRIGAGLALVVAPLTAAVLDSAPANMAGSASGVNNAVARAGGLLAVAVLPGVAGISGADYADPVAFSAGFHVAVFISAGLMILAAALAAIGIRRPARSNERIAVENCTNCAISTLPAHPTTDNP